MSEPLLLRPHHALCIRFFEGKGYSEEFVRHMTDVIGYLNNYDPLITLADGCDCICTVCPKRENGVCRDDDKVRKIDNRVISVLQIESGDPIQWSTLYENAYQAVIRRGKLSEICRDCQWLNICITKSE